MSQDSNSSRTWSQRTFSPLKKESMRSAIFAMLMSAIGLGVFSLHKLFADVGIVAAIVLIFIYGGFNFMCARFVIQASLEAGESKSLGELVQHYLGRKYLVFYDTVLFIMLVTTLVAQLLAMGGMILNNFGPLIFDLLKVPVEKRTDANFLFWSSIVLGVFLLVVLLLDPASKMGFASMAAFLIFLGTSITAMVQTPAYYAINGKDLNVTGFSLEGYLKRGGLLIFAFNCIYNYYTAYNNISNPTEGRLTKVFGRTFIVLGVLFTVLGCCFYMSLGPVLSQKVKLFIDRPQIGDSDVVMKIFRGLFTLCLLVSFILTVEPCKAITGRFVSARKNFFLSAFLFTLGPVIVACLYQDVTSVISITGAALTTIIVFTTPTLLALVCGRYNHILWKVGLSVFLVFTLFTGLYGSYLAFKEKK